MTDFSVKISVRNARLMRALQKAGYKTQAELARAMGRHISRVNALFSFRSSPLLASGEWSDLAMDISSFLHLEPEELWPEQLKYIQMKKNSREVSLSAEEVKSIAAPRTMEIDRASLNRLLGSLNPKDKTVLEMRYGLNGGGEMTLEEVAKEFGVTRENIRQREQRAFRAMKRPSLLKYLHGIDASDVDG